MSVCVSGSLYSFNPSFISPVVRLKDLDNFVVSPRCSQEDGRGRSGHSTGQSSPDRRRIGIDSWTIQDNLNNKIHQFICRVNFQKLIYMYKTLLISIISQLLNVNQVF